MCRYCDFEEEGEEIIERERGDGENWPKNFIVESCIGRNDDGRYYISADTYIEGAVSAIGAGKEINFCPFCGRNLKMEDNSELPPEVKAQILENDRKLREREDKK